LFLYNGTYVLSFGQYGKERIMFDFVTNEGELVLAYMVTAVLAGAAAYMLWRIVGRRIIAGMQPARTGFGRVVSTQIAAHPGQYAAGRDGSGYNTVTYVNRTVTVEWSDGSREEFNVTRKQFDKIAKGDAGQLTVKERKLVGFVKE